MKIRSIIVALITVIVSSVAFSQSNAEKENNISEVKNMMQAKTRTYRILYVFPHPSMGKPTNDKKTAKIGRNTGLRTNLWF